jgi:adenylyltransferase/sulfurtransferase
MTFSAVDPTLAPAGKHTLFIWGQYFPFELDELIKKDREVQIIDVREPHEFEIARIPHTKLIPLGEIVKRVKEIDSSRTAILHCKGGVRSAKAIEELKKEGFSGRLINLKGGIAAWSDEVDSTVPKY